MHKMNNENEKIKFEIKEVINDEWFDLRSNEMFVQ